MYGILFCFGGLRLIHHVREWVYQVVEHLCKFVNSRLPRQRKLLTQVAAFLFPGWLRYEKEEVQARDSRFGTLELSGGLLERTDLSRLARLVAGRRDGTRNTE